MVTQECNGAMAALLRGARDHGIVILDSALASYIEDGIAVGSDQTVVSVAASRGSRVRLDDLADRVELEAFVNKIHLDDWCSDELAEATATEKLAHALVLADRIGASASAMARGVAVAVVISAA